MKFFKRPLGRVVLIFTLFFTILVYQGCEEKVKSVENKDSQSDEVKNLDQNLNDHRLGGGDAYDGKVTIIAPPSMSPGDTVVVYVENGTPPYNISSSNSTAVISPIDKNSFSLYLPPTVTENQIRLSAVDSQGEQAEDVFISIIGINKWFFKSPRDLEVDSFGNMVVVDNVENQIVILNAEGSTVSSFGKFGTGLGELNNPGGIDLDDSGHIYIAGYYNHRVQVFDYAGNLKLNFGSKGSGLGQFNQPIDLSTDSHGYIYVADYWNHRIQVFYPDGRWKFSFGSQGDSTNQFNRPKAIDIGPDGRVYVVDNILKDTGSCCRIRAFGADGVFQFQLLDPITKNNEVPPYQLDSVGDISVDQDGKIYLTNQNTNAIYVFDPNGQFLWGKESPNIWNGPSSLNPGDLNQPSGLTVQRDKIYVADAGNGRIQVFSLQGNYLSDYGSAGSGLKEFASPNGVFVSQGKIFVTDSGNHRVSMFSSQGVFLLSFGAYGDGEGQMNSPHGVIVDNDNQIFVVDTNNDRVQVFDDQGGFKFSFGPRGLKNSYLRRPKGIAIGPQKNLFVADHYNDRIQVFSSSGSYIRTIGEPDPSINRIETLSSPYGVAVDDQGIIYVANTHGSNIKVYDADGNFIRSFGEYGSADGQFIYPQGIYVWANKIFVADTRNDRIQVFDLNGVHLLSFGSHGTLKGQFVRPTGIFVTSEGRILITDRDNNRVQIF